MQNGAKAAPVPPRRDLQHTAAPVRISAPRSRPSWHWRWVRREGRPPGETDRRGRARRPVFGHRMPRRRAYPRQNLTLPGRPVSVTRMSSSPSEVRLTLEPGRRFEAIDVTRRVAAEAGDLLTRHGKAFYCSLHTTAGYLHRSLLARLHHRTDRLDLFFGAFRALFPPGGAYHHDRLHLRKELS